ncbi:MAG: hypothetical protein ACOYNI_02870 [Acidimicrobiia bacterium]
MVMGISALPAGADQFTSNNIAPTVTIDTDLPSTLDPTEQVTVQVTIHDDNTLGNADEWGGNTLRLCIMRQGEVCYTTSALDATHVGTDGSYKKALWTLTRDANNATQAVPDGTVTAENPEGDNGTWSIDEIEQTGTYDSTEITLSITITVGHVARSIDTGGAEANDWGLQVVTTDEGSYDVATQTGVNKLTADDSGTFNKTVSNYYELTTPDERDFGNVNPNAATAPYDSTLSGIKANTPWVIKYESDATWTTGGNSISLVTSAPGNNEFAMRCQAQKTDAADEQTTVAAGNYIDSSVTDVKGPDGNSFSYSPMGSDNSVSGLHRDDYAGRDRGMRCLIDNGYTRAGTYSGTVTASIGQPQ